MGAGAALMPQSLLCLAPVAPAQRRTAGCHMGTGAIQKTCKCLKRARCFARALLSPEQSAGVDCLLQSKGVCKTRLSAAIKRAQQLNQLCNVSMRVSFQIDEAQIAWVGCATVLTAARTACN